MLSSDSSLVVIGIVMCTDTHNDNCVHHWTLFVPPRVLFVVVPIYIAELAPKRQRGRMVNLITVWLAGGILVSYHIMQEFCQMYDRLYSLSNYRVVKFARVCNVSFGIWT